MTPFACTKIPQNIYKQKRQLVAVLMSGAPAQTRAKGKPFHFAESRKESHCKTRHELATPTLTSNVDSLSFWGKVALYQLSYFRICFTNSAHFWLRSLHESKLPNLRTRKAHLQKFFLGGAKNSLSLAVKFYSSPQP